MAESHESYASPLPFTFGGLMVMMVLVGLLAVGLAYRIGPVVDRSDDDED